VSAPITIIGVQKASIELKDTGSTCLPYAITLVNKTAAATKSIWYFSDGTSLVGDSVRYIFKNNGEYAVKLRTQSTQGCTYEDSMPISVKVPERTVSFNSGYTCANNNVTFNAALIPGDSVRWNFGDGTSLITQQSRIQHKYINGGTFIPTVQVLAATGCTMPLSVKDTIKVDAINADFTLHAVFDCGKATYQFLDSSNSIFGIQQWTWLANNQLLGNQSALSQVYTTEGNHNITLVVKGKSGCSDTTQATYNVKIYQYPKASIQSVQDVCRTALINFTGNATSQDSIIYKQWDLGNGTTSKDSITAIIYNNSGDYKVKYTVSTINHCADSALKQITVHALPKVAAMAPQRICKGDSIQLNVSGAERYIWKDQKNNIICENCTVPTVAPTANTQYYVVGYNEFGCSQMSATNITVIQPFKLLVSPNDTICSGQQKQIIAIGANNYQWVAPDGSSLGTSSSLYVSPTNSTTYSVIAKDSYNCFTDTGKVSIIVGNPTQITVGKDTILQAGDVYNFRAVAEKQDIKQWAWSGANNLSCYNCQEPQAKISDDACISCVATNVYGCQSADTICLKTFCPTAEIYVPNVFTPDGDGINDVLMVQGKGIKVIKHFMIFNRWGELLFERSNFMPGDPAYAWDGKIRGKPATPDVFVYVCEVLCEKGLPNIYKGNVAILK
jgi:gliding motility-associated-like protein